MLFQRCNVITNSFPYSMGFARLAETSIRKIRGKGEDGTLGPMDKILASSIGGALATWNQPIEVIRVEVRIIYLCIAVSHANVPPSDAINGQGLRQPSGQAHYHEHACVHLQGKRNQGPLPWRHPSDRAGHLADYLHGFVRRLRQNLGEGSVIGFSYNV